jgi:hypothetical protein
MSSTIQREDYEEVMNAPWGGLRRFADKLGVSMQTIYAWRCGARKPKMPTRPKGPVTYYGEIEVCWTEGEAKRLSEIKESRAYDAIYCEITG